ncbi:MAG TPA: T9SS type A sorting domain-containing protein [Bacteroidia bacterium]|nr:T9SS type A sorting domain-containing protein [Bacteroidia bacterium]HRH08825.1 T9SS type A sorting domain-containing protein [Bacteroidia bacterium]
MNKLLIKTINPMKQIVLALFIFLCTLCNSYAQAIIGFDTTYAINIPDTVHQNDSINFKVRLKNYGTVPIDSIEIRSGVLGSGFISSIATEFTFPYIQSITLQAGDTFSTRVLSNCSPNRFALGIDVVVIWPRANGALTLDSLKDTILVLTPNQIAVLLKNNGFTVFPNPFSSSVQILSIASVKEVLIYDSAGKWMCTRKKDDCIDLSDLADGIYVFVLRATNGREEKIRVIKNASATTH